MERYFDHLLDLLAAICGAILVFMMLSIGMDVTARLLFSYSFTWTLEGSEHGLLAIFALGMPWLAREKGHVGVEFITDTLPAALKAPLARIVALFVALLLGMLAFWAVRAAMNDYSHNITTFGIHPIPRFLLPSLVAIGMGLTALQYFREAVTGGHAKPSLDKEMDK